MLQDSDCGRGSCHNGICKSPWEATNPQPNPLPGRYSLLLSNSEWVCSAVELFWPNVKSNRRKLSLLWGGGGDGPLSSWWPAWPRPLTSPWWCRQWSPWWSSWRGGERSAIAHSLKTCTCCSWKWRLYHGLFCPILHPFSICRKSLEAFSGQSEFKAFVCFQPMGEGSDFEDKECERGVAAIMMTTQHWRLIITILDCDPTCSNEHVSLQRWQRQQSKVQHLWPFSANNQHVGQ